MAIMKQFHIMRLPPINIIVDETLVKILVVLKKLLANIIKSAIFKMLNRYWL